MTILKLSVAAGLVGLAFAACKTPGPAPTSAGLEAWDTRNGPDLFGADVVTYDMIKGESWQTGKLDAKPWTDTYWPLTDAGFAARWIDQNSASPFQLSTDVSDPQYNQKVSQEVNRLLQEVAENANQEWQQTIGVSPAEKYDIGIGDSNFTLTKNELTNFAQNRKAYSEIQWGWMGHCHGWAPASYLFKTPERGVLVNNQRTGKKVLFTPGDVRGLLTKAAADNPFAANTSFMGTRCNDASANIPRDELNRIVDGSIGTWNNGSWSNQVPVRILLNNWFNYNEINTRGIEIVFQIGPDFENAKPLWLVARQWKDQRNKIVSVDIYSTARSRRGIYKDMLLVSTNSNNLGQRYSRFGRPTGRPDPQAAKQLWAQLMAGHEGASTDPMAYVNFKYYKECRDLNPGSFHTVLARYMSNGGTTEQNKPRRSFVMDITRDDQVWNHAIYQFDSSIGEPTPLTIGEGEEAVEDPFKTWRAPGTKNIVDVYTRVIFAVENGPKIIYAPEDEAVSQKWLHYTLELDEQGKVIGGEWHGVTEGADGTAKSGAALLTNLQESISQNLILKPDSPDFIWGYPENTFVNNGSIIKAEFVKKVHQCSIDTASEAQSIEVGGKTFDYVECSY